MNFNPHNPITFRVRVKPAMHMKMYNISDYLLKRITVPPLGRTQKSEGGSNHLEE